MQRFFLHIKTWTVLYWKKFSILAILFFLIKGLAWLFLAYLIID